MLQLPRKEMTTVPLADHEQTRIKLIDEYKTVIEESTILALISDYDLADIDQKIAAQHTLQLVRTSAIEDKKNLVLEEYGKSFFKCKSVATTSDDSIATENPQEWNIHTDNSSQSSAYIHEDLRALRFSEDETKVAISDSPEQNSESALSGFGEKDKGSLLSAMFPALKAYDIIYVLQKYDGNIDQAIDELMTESFLEETGERQKGIDGFMGSCNGYISRSKKVKQGKKKGIKPEPIRNSSLLPPPEVKSSWDIGRENIEFLTRRLDMSTSQITSIYHETGASLPKTIMRIIETSIEDASTDPEGDLIAHTNALKLHDDFPSFSILQIKAVYFKTQYNVNTTRELLQVLSSSCRHEQMGELQITIRHTPLDLNSNNSAARLIESKELKSNIPSASAANVEATIYLEARNSAFAKATAAYRRSKSDRLMAAVATYYAEEGHAYNAKAKKMYSTAADLIATSQSSRNHIDLHGLRVQDAVRIARERVTTWWHEENCLRNEIRQYKNQPSYYRLVTGSGLHSKDGVSRLGPAVAKMLKREDWKFHACNGMIVVTGLSQSPSKKRAL